MFQNLSKMCAILWIKIVRKKCFLAFFFTFARGGNDYAWFNKTLF
jgi:hypothetical protein